MIQRALIKALAVANVCVLLLWLSPYFATSASVPDEALSRFLEAVTKQESGKIAEMREVVSGRPGRHALVALFTGVSATCASGRMIETLVEHARSRQSEILVLLPGNYASADAHNLAVNSLSEPLTDGSCRSLGGIPG